ncbi:MAG: CPCC family cysteine-rich protein [Polyangiaceae bacterium]
MQARDWSSQWDGISEESVRRLHRPNYRHRISPHRYPHGTAFSGRQRAGTCYVLEGACEFKFGGESVLLHAEQFAALPGGDYTFRVVGDSELHLVNVWELPFEVVHHRRDGIEYLEDHGISAEARDWVLGRTIHAVQLPEELSIGFTLWQRAVYLAPEPGGWFTEHMDPRFERRTFSNLKEACDHVIEAWLDPSWPRLSREDAKRLLVTYRGDHTTDDLPFRQLKYSLNSYLREELRTLGHEVLVEGQVEFGGLCPCCEHYSIDAGEDGLWDICPVCSWENGGDGRNHMTLEQAKQNFGEIRACDARMLEHLAPDRLRKYQKLRASRAMLG